MKATAAALNPKGLDLISRAPARVANRVESAPRVATDLAAYALGFSAADIVIQGETVRGAPLGANLLRLKYAEQVSATAFSSALLLLLHRYGGTTKAAHMLHAVAAGALVEWLTDECPECRGAEAGQVEAQPCPVCPKGPPGEQYVELIERGARRRWQLVTTVVPGRRATEPCLDPWGVPYLDREGAPIMRVWIASSPVAGCAKCGGVGRVFSVPKERRGVRCLKCHGTGRLAFKSQRRFRLVNTFLVAQRRAGMKLKMFHCHWAVRYYHFLDVLQSIDRQMGAGIDYGLRAGRRRNERFAVKGVDAEGNLAENAPIEPEPEEKQDRVMAERSGVLQSKSPPEPTGELPPKYS